MVEKDRIVRLRNRNNGSVGYTIPDLQIHRRFSVNEVKEVTVDEIRKLAYTVGGEKILRDYLVIEDAEVVAEILGDVEPEYHYTQENVKDLLLNGTLEELQDCLDFAPAGTINMVQEEAVKTEINDIKKREAILEATGFNVNAAILVNKMDAEVEEETEAKPARRAAAPKATPGRRTESRYKIVK